MYPVIKKIEPTNEIDKLLYTTWSKKLKPEWIEVGESKTSFPVFYKIIAEKIENFQVRPDDIYVTSHPRSGTTWSQEMTWLIANDCDFEKAKERINSRVPYMENHIIFPEEDYKEAIKLFPFMDVFKNAPNAKSPRIFKSHNPFDLLPRQIRENEVQPKIIYVFRNPKDACVSYYHFSKTMYDFLGTFEEYCEQFLAGRTFYGPYWNHVLSYWNQRHRPNILIIRYEDLKRKMPEVLRRVAKFLDKELTEEQVVALTDHLSFEKLSKNEYVNNEDIILYMRKKQTDDTNCAKFMRKGKVGGYKEEMSPEMIKRFDEWIEENTKGTGLSFD